MGDEKKDEKEPVQLTLEQGIEMQDDLIKGYYDEDFQTKIYEEYKKAGKDDLKKMQAKAEACQDVQFAVIPKYGFEATRKGVQESLKAFTPEMNGHPEVTWRNNLMQYLIDPDQQMLIADKNMPVPMGVFPSRAKNPHPSDWPETGGKAWRVIGGEKSGGIKVRKDEDVKSPELKDKIQFGALIEEIDRKPDRLKYEKMAGNGPEIGWVSLTFKDKPLLKPMWQEEKELAVKAGEGQKVTYKVVNDRVAKRAAAAKDGAIVGAGLKGNKVSGHVVEVSGVQWLKIREKPPTGDDVVDMFMMIDGKSVGLGTLMEKVDK